MALSLPPVKWIAAGAAALAVLAGALLAFRSIEQFLIRDPRFALAGPETDSATLEVVGASHTPPRAVEAVFADDFGLSVYLIPLSERRAALRNVDWVKDASVARFWPNRVVVAVTERKPVAFLSVAGGQARIAQPLIDADGVILPASRDRFTLPVLAGVSAGDPLPQRRDRVQRMLRVMKDLGPAAGGISQIDVSDPDDVKVNEPFEGRSVTLLLGDRDFGVRHQNFVNYYAEIRKKLPNAAVLDLRLEDRITVAQ